MTSQSQNHEIVQIALVTCRCSCSWAYFNHELRGKSDEELAASTMGAFEDHKREAK